VIAEETYVVRASGGRLVPVEETLATPDANEDVSLVLRSVVGATVALKVVSADGVEIPGAATYCYWEQGYTDARSTDPLGEVTHDGVPGLFWVSAEADGYAEASQGPHRANDSPILVRLARSGQLQGRVSASGQPVPNYELVYWQDDPLQMVTHTVRQSSDGSFALKDAPAGHLSILASSDRFPRSAVHHVLVSPDTFVDIEFSEPLAAEGRIVDGVRGTPLEGAAITTYTNYGGQLLAPWGTPITTGADGSFFGGAFPEGDIRAVVTYPGYQPFTLSAHGVAGETVDFGVVPLYGPRALEVVLVPPATQSATDFSLSGETTSRRLAPLPFPETGVLTLEDCGPGRHFLEVTSAAGEAYYLTPFLDLADEWRVELDLRGGRELAVEVDGERGSAVFASLSHGGRGGKGTTSVGALDGSGRARFLGVRRGEAVASLLDSEGSVVGMRRFEVDLGRESVKVGVDAGARELRLVEPGGRPVGGAEVWVQCVGGGSGWSSYGASPGDGRCSIVAPCDEWLVSVVHPGLGGMFGRRVDGRGEVVEVVFEAELDLSVRFVDEGGKAVSGLRATLVHEESGFVVGERAAASDGRAVWRRLSGAEYRVRAVGARGEVVDELVELGRGREVFDVRVSGGG